MNNIFKKKYIYFNVNYVKSTIEGYNFPFVNKAVTNYSAQSQIMLPWEITNTMSYFILPKGTWEIYQIEKPIQQFDVSFNKDFMDKKLKIGLPLLCELKLPSLNLVKSRLDILELLLLILP